MILLGDPDTNGNCTGNQGATWDGHSQKKIEKKKQDKHPIWSACGQEK